MHNGAARIEFNNLRIFQKFQIAETLLRFVTQFEILTRPGNFVTMSYSLLLHFLNILTFNLSVADRNTARELLWLTYGG